MLWSSDEEAMRVVLPLPSCAKKEEVLKWCKQIKCDHIAEVLRHVEMAAKTILSDKDKTTEAAKWKCYSRSTLIANSAHLNNKVMNWNVVEQLADDMKVMREIMAVEADKRNAMTLKINNLKKEIKVLNVRNHNVGHVMFGGADKS